MNKIETNETKLKFAELKEGLNEVVKQKDADYIADLIARVKNSDSNPNTKSVNIQLTNNESQKVITPNTQIYKGDIKLYKPLDNIALAFSGGGFRASAFNLGVLSYYSQLRFNGSNLLQNVKYLSSTSGGTITAAYYAYFTANEKLSNIKIKSDIHIDNEKDEPYIKQRGQFNKYFKFLTHHLKGTQVLEAALKILNDKKSWHNKDNDEYKNKINPNVINKIINDTDIDKENNSKIDIKYAENDKDYNNKSRNLINSFALTYDRRLFNESSLDVLLKNEGKSHLEEVCFTSVELYMGKSFRHQLFLGTKYNAEKSWKNIFIIENHPEKEQNLTETKSTDHLYNAFPNLFKIQFINTINAELKNDKKFEKVSEYIDHIRLKARSSQLKPIIELQKLFKHNLFSTHFINLLLENLNVTILKTDVKLTINKEEEIEKPTISQSSNRSSLILATKLEFYNKIINSIQYKKILDQTQNDEKNDTKSDTDTKYQVTQEFLDKIAENPYLQNLHAAICYKIESNIYYDNQNYYYGNKYVHIKNLSTISKFKLGDIVASSSCFPSGFEPLFLSSDFSYIKNKQDSPNLSNTDSNDPSKQDSNDSSKEVELSCNEIADNLVINDQGNVNIGLRDAIENAIYILNLLKETDTNDKTDDIQEFIKRFEKNGRFANILRHNGLNFTKLKSILYPLELFKITKFSQLKKLEETNNFTDIQDLALMDGGITDNQALTSMMNADKSRSPNKFEHLGHHQGTRKFGLMMVNDVSSHLLNSHMKTPLSTSTIGKLNLNRLTKGMMALFGLSVFLYILLGYLATNSQNLWLLDSLTDKFSSDNSKINLIEYFLGSLMFIGIIIPILYWIFYKKIKNMFWANNNQSEDLSGLAKTFGRQSSKLLGQYLFSTNINTLSNLIGERVKSVFLLTNSIFLNQVRTLIYEEFETNYRYNKRRICNNIYDWTTFNEGAANTQILQTSSKFIDNYYLINQNPEPSENAIDKGFRIQLYSDESLIFQNILSKIEIEEKFIVNKLFDEYVDQTKTNLHNKLTKKFANWLQPTLRIKELANEAFNMPTTLWFEDLYLKSREERHREDQMLYKIIVIGQYNTCMALFSHLQDLKSEFLKINNQAHITENDKVVLKLNKEYLDEILKLENKILGDILKFKNDPFFLIKEMERFDTLYICNEKNNN